MTSDDSTMVPEPLPMQVKPVEAPVSPKSPSLPVPSSEPTDAFEVPLKRARLDADARDTSSEQAKPEQEATVEETKESADSPYLPKTINEQVKYYLSDDNLATDSFFHGIFASSPDQVMELSYILSCKRIEQLGGTLDDIIAAVKCLEGRAEVVPTATDETSDKKTGFSVKLLTPLVPLLPKPISGNNSVNPKVLRGLDIHAGGAMLKVTNLPEEATLESFKKYFNQYILELGDLMKKESGVAPSAVSENNKFAKEPIFFVSHPAQKTSYVVLKRSATDKEVAQMAAQLSTEEDKENAVMQAAVMNGVRLNVVYLSSNAEGLRVVKEMMPPTMAQIWERNINHLKKALARPIIVGDVEFVSVEHLKRCLRDVISKSSPGTICSEKVESTLRAILAYHPRGAGKLAGAQKFSVDLAVKNTDNSKPSKCFHVHNADGTKDDFSILKCLNGLAQNPPFKDLLVEQTKTGQTTTPETEQPNEPLESKDTEPAAELEAETAATIEKDVVPAAAGEVPESRAETVEASV